MQCTSRRILCSLCFRLVFLFLACGLVRGGVWCRVFCAAVCFRPGFGWLVVPCTVLYFFLSILNARAVRLPFVSVKKK
jgi:hypothetical protein